MQSLHMLSLTNLRKNFIMERVSDIQGLRPMAWAISQFPSIDTGFYIAICSFY